MSNDTIMKKKKEKKEGQPMLIVFNSPLKLLDGSMETLPSPKIEREQINYTKGYKTKNKNKKQKRTRNFQSNGEIEKKNHFNKLA